MNSGMGTPPFYTTSMNLQVPSLGVKDWHDIPGNAKTSDTHRVLSPAQVVLSSLRPGGICSVDPDNKGCANSINPPRILNNTLRPCTFLVKPGINLPVCQWSGGTRCSQRAKQKELYLILQASQMQFLSIPLTRTFSFRKHSSRTVWGIF